MGITDIFSVLRYGEQVANPAAWKTGQITVNVLSGFALAVLNFGSSWLPVLKTIDVNTVNMAAGLVLSLANLYLTPATSAKVGVLPAKE